MHALSSFVGGGELNFSRQCFSVEFFRLSWSPHCEPGSPQTQKSFCLARAGSKGLHHHTQLQGSSRFLLYCSFTQTVLRLGLPVVIGCALGYSCLRLDIITHPMTLVSGPFLPNLKDNLSQSDHRAFLEPVVVFVF